MKYNIFIILTAFTVSFLFSNCSSEDDFGEMEEMIATMAEKKMTRAAEEQGKDEKPNYKGEIVLIKTINETLSKDLKVNGQTYIAVCNVNVQIIIYEMIKDNYNPQTGQKETVYIHNVEVVPLDRHDSRVELSSSLEHLSRESWHATVNVIYDFNFMPDNQINVIWNYSYNITVSDE